MVMGSFGILFRENINIFFRDNGNPLLDVFFKIITNAGSEPAYIFIASLIFWCLDKKTGIRIMYVIIFSAFIAIISKNLFGMPRPPAYLHKVIENDFGFPSGHAQVSASFWSYLGSVSKNNRIVAFGVIAVLLVSFSRIYLGVHYPGDVIGGIVFGLIVAFISYRGEKRVLKIFNELNRILKYIIVLSIPLIIVLTGSLQKSLIKEQLELGLVMASISIGYLLEEDTINFMGVGNRKQAIKRAIIGIMILSLVYLISSILSLINPVFAYLKYGALGFSSIYIVPLIFTKMEDRDTNN